MKLIIKCKLFIYQQLSQLQNMIIETLKNTKSNTYNNKSDNGNFLNEKYKRDKMLYNQSEYYKIIENNTKIQNKYQNKKFDTVRRYQFENEFQYTKDIEEKTRLYNLVDFQLSTIKAETKDLELKLHNLHKEQMKKELEATKLDNKNDELKWTIDIIKKSNKIELFKISKFYHNLKVESIEEIVLNFNKLRLHYETCYNQVILLSLHYNFSFKT